MIAIALNLGSYDSDRRLKFHKQMTPDDGHAIVTSEGARQYEYTSHGGRGASRADGAQRWPLHL
jgi:hypothetical protein